MSQRAPELAGLDLPELEQVLALARREPRHTLATAESCTGGLLAAALTARPGSSDFFRGGLVAYADQVKRELLGVGAEDLELHGAVSREVALAMAQGARSRFGSDLGVSTTGVAGPGASQSKPAGLIFVALAGAEGATVRRLEVDQGRERNRLGAVRAALQLIVEALS